MHNKKNSMIVYCYEINHWSGQRQAGDGVGADYTGIVAFMAKLAM